MTNILLLPIFDGTKSAFSINRNADWVGDNIYFAQPGYGPPVVLTNCSLTNGSNIATVSSTTGISPGMLVAPVAGTIIGGFVGAVTSATQLTVIDVNGAVVNATATNAGAVMLFNPPPLDLTGIKFIANLRVQPGASQSNLTARTTDGTLTNGARSGVLGFAVPQAKVFAVPAGLYVMDMLAIADNHIIDLFPIPALVTVTGVVSDSNLL